MPRNEPPKLTTRSFDTLFRGTQQIQQDGAPVLIALDKLEPYKNHPFRLYEGERLELMVESVKQNGIINPIIARPKQNGNYEILAGHNRVHAAEVAGLKEAPAFVNDVDDDTAALIVVETNLSQRSTSDMLPSEKAKAYKIQLDVLKRQGKRSDLTLSQNGTRYNAYEKIAEENNSSRNQIHRFIRLNYLSETLLAMVDDNKLSLDCGAALSFLPAEHQEILCGLIDGVTIKPDMAKAIRELSESGDFDRQKIKDIISPPKKVKKAFTLKIKFSDVRDLIESDVDEKQLAEEFIEFLKQRKQNIE